MMKLVGATVVISGHATSLNFRIWRRNGETRAVDPYPYKMRLAGDAPGAPDIHSDEFRSLGEAVREAKRLILESHCEADLKRVERVVDHGLHEIRMAEALLLQHKASREVRDAVAEARFGLEEASRALADAAKATA